MYIYIYKKRTRKDLLLLNDPNLSNAPDIFRAPTFVKHGLIKTFRQGSRFIAMELKLKGICIYIYTWYANACKILSDCVNMVKSQKLTGLSFSF